jgi:diguanylate cyclase (GGDEF)-like protein
MNDRPAVQQSLLEQVELTELEIEARKNLLGLTDTDSELLRTARPFVEPELERLVAGFYQDEIAIQDVAALIGDADTLARLGVAMRRYLGELFLGCIDADYVTTRLRIGLVHTRIGVEPKYFLSAVHSLKQRLIRLVLSTVPEVHRPTDVAAAVERVLFFDAALIFDMYIRSVTNALAAEQRKTARYAAELEEQVRERTRRLEEQSRTDPLTGLFNVRYLLETLNRELRAAERRSEPLSVAYLDIDGFKAINDTHGHLLGDQVLRQIAVRLRSALRDVDCCFRCGGDEFCVVLPGCTEADARRLFSERSLGEFAGEPVPYMVSIGVAQTGPEEFVSADDLLRSADGRMYEAKHTRQPHLPRLARE